MLSDDVDCFKQARCLHTEITVVKMLLLLLVFGQWFAVQQLHFVHPFEFHQKTTTAAVEKQGSADEASSEKVKVYVRVRPLSKEERERAEEQVRSLTRRRTRSPLLTPLQLNSIGEVWLFNVSCVGVMLENEQSQLV